MNSSFAQSAAHSFDSPRNMSMNVSATPPPRPTLQSQMSFTMGGNTGMVPKSNSFSGYGDLNGSQPPQFFAPDVKTPIYTVGEPVFTVAG